MQWLKVIRLGHMKTQADISQGAYIPQSYYSRIERGEVGESLPVPTAKRIAAVLGFHWTRFYEEESPQ